MTVYEKLRTTMASLVPVCVPGDYDGPESEYCVFHIDAQPDVFAEGSPAAVVCLIIMDWYCPKNQNTVLKRRQICQTLASSGFTYPYVTDASDSKTQRHVFQFETLEVAENG